MKLQASKQGGATNFYGHGKLLITSEYFVLDGAQALAVPTRLGQTLRITELSSHESILYWVALNIQKKPWLNLVFETENFTCLNSKQEEAASLSNLLIEARKLNPEFLISSLDLAIETYLEFPGNWGLGSSSTLVHCISKWAGINGYALLKNTIGGSGYDVACAAADSPILYQVLQGKPVVSPVLWEPLFSNNIFFAYTGRKQLSSDAIKKYKQEVQDKSFAIDELTRLTTLILNCADLNEFESLIEEHESLIASQLHLTKVKDSIFSDYAGSVKSLGAWGGDFVMITCEKPENELKNYLKEKNISIVFGWKDLILK